MFPDDDTPVRLASVNFFIARQAGERGGVLQCLPGKPRRQPHLASVSESDAEGGRAEDAIAQLAAMCPQSTSHLSMISWKANAREMSGPWSENPRQACNPGTRAAGQMWHLPIRTLPLTLRLAKTVLCIVSNVKALCASVNLQMLRLSNGAFAQSRVCAAEINVD
ncbi:hypothetical protein EJ06DRAFT_520988 [Trichodelitschia bisporula]|uniref:Uncharacterized protein n=1 Tax=Trichodelitschia bisporula TaxID=703511 RepID=A0A6G1HZB6_9PEZI|nr:hypothetical protein EJ06DRAFT_520988 [Trichodelitschia bisporula]